MNDKLIIQACVCAGQVKRGMLIRAAAGEQLGIVAGLVCQQNTEKVTHLLMSDLPPTAVYRLIPLDLVDHIWADNVQLSLSVSEIEARLVPYLSNHQG